MADRAEVPASVPVAPIARRYQATLLIHHGAWGPLRALLATAGLLTVHVDHGASPVPCFEVLPSGRESPAGVAAAKAVTLTPREFQVLRGMALGQTNKRIADNFLLSEDTVKTHARRLFRKLGARDRAHAVAIGYQRHML